jgi:hypothetical protein
MPDISPSQAALAPPTGCDDAANTITVTRRSVMAGIGLLAGGCAGFSGELANAPAPRVDSDAALQRFVRLRSSPGHAPVMWVFDGVLLAKPEGRVAVPLVRSSGVSLTQVRPRGAGLYDFRLEEVGYFRDLASGEVLERWTNPLTGREVRPRNYRTPESLQLRPEGPRAPSMPPEIEFHGALTTLAEVAGLVAMAEDLYVRVPASAAVAATADAPARAARRERHLASLGTYAASARDLQRPASEWVDCQLSYATMNSFADWLGMADVPGVQNLRLAGRKRPHTDVDAIPGWLRARIARDHPGFLDVMTRWLREGAATDGTR